MYGEAYRPELEPLALSVYNVSKPDDVQPYLKLEQHMQIARALWEFNPSDYYARVQASVPTILAIEAGATPHAQTQAAVEAAKANIKQFEMAWMPDTIHDIPWQRPQELANIMRDFLRGK